MVEWTSDQDDKLRELWAQGLSCAAIGRIMGVSKNAVSGRRNRLHLTPRQEGVGGRPRAVDRNEKRRIPEVLRKSKPDKTVALYVFPIERIRAALPATKTPRGKCLFTSGQRGSWFLCDAPVDVDSIWCGEHRSTCAVRVQHPQRVPLW